MTPLTNSHLANNASNFHVIFLIHASGSNLMRKSEMCAKYFQQEVLPWRNDVSENSLVSLLSLNYAHFSKCHSLLPDIPLWHSDTACSLSPFSLTRMHRHAGGTSDNNTNTVLNFYQDWAVLDNNVPFLLMLRVSVKSSALSDMLSQKFPQSFLKEAIAQHCL